MERPDERENFQHDLPDWGLEHRGILIHAALLLVQAWIARGKPMGTEVMGSYESWAQTLGGILKVAGVDGFLTNAAEKRSATDDDATEWKALCEKWFEKYESETVKTTELFPLAKENELFFWLMTSESETGNRQKFGRALKKKVGCVYDGRQIVEAGQDSRSRGRQYKLVELPPPGERIVPIEEVVRVLGLEREPIDLTGQLELLKRGECYHIMDILYEIFDYADCLEKHLYDIKKENEAGGNNSHLNPHFVELVRIENNTRIAALKADLHIQKHRHPILNAACIDQRFEYEMAPETRWLFEMIDEALVSMHNYDANIWNKLLDSGKEPESVQGYSEIHKLANWADNIGEHLLDYRLRFDKGCLDDMLDS